MTKKALLVEVVVIGLAGVCLVACSDDGPGASAGDPVTQPPAESTPESLAPFPPFTVFVAWAADGLQVNLHQRQEDANIAMTCNAVESTRTSPGDIVNVLLPAGGQVEVDCAISNGYAFHLAIPGLERLPDGEFRRGSSAEEVLASCGRTTTRTYDATEAAWLPGTRWLDCTNAIVTFEPDPVSEVLLFKTAVEG